MRIGLFGGSFDPIHYGHLRPVRRALEALALDRVLYLPTAVPPHKTERRLTPAPARYAMVELALLGEEKMFASAVEMRPDRPSFTVDTLEHFRAELPAARLFLVIGGDSLAELTSWRHWRRILELAELAVLARPGRELEAGGDRSPPELQPPELRGALVDGRLHLLRNPPADLSSTEVRRAVAEDAENLSALVPALVLDYIRKYDLYRGDRGPSLPTSMLP